MSKSSVDITGSCLNIVLENLLVDASVMMTTKPFWTFWSYVNVSSSGWVSICGVSSARSLLFQQFQQVFSWGCCCIYVCVCVDLLVYHYTPTTITGSWCCFFFMSLVNIVQDWIQSNFPMTLKYLLDTSAVYSSNFMIFFNVLTPTSCFPNMLTIFTLEHDFRWCCHACFGTLDSATLRIIVDKHMCLGACLTTHREDDGTWEYLSTARTLLHQTCFLITLQGTNISHPKALLKMIFLFSRWDMLVPWRVYIVVSFHFSLAGMNLWW